MILSSTHWVWTYRALYALNDIALAYAILTILLVP